MGLGWGVEWGVRLGLGWGGMAHTSNPKTIPTAAPGVSINASGSSGGGEGGGGALGWTGGEEQMPCDTDGEKHRVGQEWGGTKMECDKNRGGRGGGEWVV